jgi:hypothetical protein
LEQLRGLELQLEEFQRQAAYRELRLQCENEILETTKIVTEMVPDSIQSFFLREQMLGKLGQLVKNLDTFGDLKGQVREVVKHKQTKEHEME